LPMPGTSTSQYSKMELLVMDLTGPMCHDLAKNS